MKLEWRAGSWFGAQLGGTAWILVAAALAAARDLGTGGLLLVAFLAANVIGLLLWGRRRSLSCYPATQWLLAAVGVFGLLSVYLLDHAALWQTVQVGSSVTAPAGYAVVLLVVGGLMAVFHLKFGRTTGAQSV